MLNIMVAENKKFLLQSELSEAEQEVVQLKEKYCTQSNQTVEVSSLS